MKVKRLTRAQLDIIARQTLEKTAEAGLQNAKKNLPYIKKTILDLTPEAGTRVTYSAIVISAGPSLHRRPTAQAILASKFKGPIIAVDGSLGYCLRNGLVPHYVVTVDPHPNRIIRWFGDPALAYREPDDYFRRQDLDPALNRDETARNQELIELVNRHGHSIKAIISTSVSEEITLRCLEAGMELYWWNPLYDDYDKPKSYSRRVYKLTKAPCMVTGGNCGTSAWVFAHAVLQSRRTALLGMDLSYPPDTPIKNTQYYKEMVEIFGDEAEEAFIRIYNPYLKQTWFTDPTYYWYRQSLLDLARQAGCETYNCTEGGIFFGKGIKFIPLKDFLEKFS
jgi:hypothetical protein